MNHVGLIGLGLLGGALAERFLGAGMSVLGFDLRRENREALARHGGTVASSASAVAAGVERLVLCLPDSDVVEAVLGEIRDALRPGQVILDTTTGDPERTARLGALLATKEIVYVDACILGSSDQARAGEVIVMAGGPRQAIEENADLLRCFASRWFAVGDWGAGARMKLVVNLVLGLNRAVLAEGLSLARASGLDPAAALAVLRSGAAHSRVMDVKGERMLTRDFRPQARLAQHLKDVRLILDQARRSGARVPLSEVHRALLERVVAIGGGDQDNSAILRAYEE